MVEPRPGAELVVVVNSTEWRHLCARGTLRLLVERATPVSDPPSHTELERAFAAAPTTKLDSSLDLFVLELRPDWPVDARTHRAHQSVKILSLSDVSSHHLVDAEHLGYYETEAAKSGLTVADAAFEGAWRRWMRAETADAALEAACLLKNHFGRPPELGHDSGEGIPWDTITRLMLGEVAEADPATTVARLISAAPSIDDAAAALRGTEAYLLACCIEWIDLRLGRDALSDGYFAHLCRAAIGASRKIERDDNSVRAWQTEWGLAALETLYPAAFSEELPAPTVGVLVSLLTDASFRTPSLESVYSTLKFVTLHHPGATDLTCVLVASAIGPALSRQLVRVTPPVTHSE